MIPVLVVGVFFREEVEGLFTGNLVLVGSALLLTSLFLVSTHLVSSGSKNIPFLDAFVMGMAQALAIVPGISRSGATISAGLLMRNKRDDVTRFSFLMVLLPIIGAAFLDIISMASGSTEVKQESLPLVIGFVAAYLSGYMACRWMISIVRKGNLYWFAIYCAIVGVLSIIFA